MTDEELNVWERQPNVCRVLISREMGAWLKRRDENKAKQQPTVCDIEQIMAEIQRLRGCSCYWSDGIIDDVEDIIDKYK